MSIITRVSGYKYKYKCISFEKWSLLTILYSNIITFIIIGISIIMMIIDGIIIISNIKYSLFWIFHRSIGAIATIDSFCWAMWCFIIIDISIIGSIYGIFIIFSVLDGFWCCWTILILAVTRVYCVWSFIIDVLMNIRSYVLYCLFTSSLWITIIIIILYIPRHIIFNTFTHIIVHIIVIITTIAFITLARLKIILFK